MDVYRLGATADGSAHLQESVKQRKSQAVNFSHPKTRDILHFLTYTGNQTRRPLIVQNGLPLHPIKLQSNHGQPFSPYPSAIQSWSQNEMQARIAARVVAALPLATPLKGSPTATPRANDHHMIESQLQCAPSSSTLPSAMVPNGPLFQQAVSSGDTAFSTDQFIIAEFAHHAQQLRARLSPLASNEPAGLSARTATTTTTACTLPNPFSPREDMDFLGHVSVHCISAMHCLGTAAHDTHGTSSTYSRLWLHHRQQA